jgi:hypothetical protein
LLRRISQLNQFDQVINGDGILNSVRHSNLQMKLDLIKEGRAGLPSTAKLPTA